ncbi:hypothetical protein ACFZAM_10170 [Streptomyces sp. NPDC008079]|uniref:hypothetical protein n=1 Tax=Streptomyces sp. NPDC008079 TaxID=3364806 RepID=UPI0036E81FC7
MSPTSQDRKLAVGPHTPCTRRVLVAVHTLVYGQRLADLLPLLESDPRIRLVLSVAPHEFDAGATHFVRATGRASIPWEEAVRTPFDLALSAGSRGIEQVRAPVVRLPHGASHIKLARSRDPSGQRAVPGLSRDHLMWDGRVTSRAVVLAHERDRQDLARWCPEALPFAKVVGDPFFDRIKDSLPLRAAYRRALGLRSHHRLVVVNATWRPGPTVDHLRALLARLRRGVLPPEVKIAVLIHPNVWEGPDGRHLDGRLAADRNPGIEVIAPEADWRQLLIAADLLIGDHGSVSVYGAAAGVPIALSHFPHAYVNPRSPAAELARVVPLLDPARPPAEQLAELLAAPSSGHDSQRYASVVERITSEPGRFDANFRRLAYQLLGLGAPDGPPEPSRRPLPLPGALSRLSLRPSRSASSGLIRS